MGFLLYILSVVTFPAVFYQANLWTDAGAYTTGQHPKASTSPPGPVGPPSSSAGGPLPAPAQHSPPGGQPPATGPPSIPGGLPPAPAPPSPPGGLPGPPSSPGGLPPATGPPSSPGGLSPGPPSIPGGLSPGPPSIPGGQPPGTPLIPGGQPTGPPSIPGGQPPGPPSIPGGQPTGPPSIPGGQPPGPPSIPGGQPPGTPSIPGGQPPGPPSIPGGQPTGPPSIPGGQPPGPPSIPGGQPPGPPSIPGGQPPGPPSIPGGQLPGPPSIPGGQPSGPPSIPGGQLPGPPSIPGGQLPGPTSIPGGHPPGAPSPPGWQPPATGPPSIPGGHVPVPPSSGTPSFTPSLQPTGPSLESFFQSSLHRECSSDTTENDFIELTWDEEIEELGNTFNGVDYVISRYSCKYRCGVTDRAANVPLSSSTPRCYCDGLCDSFDDCCYDFDALCKNVVTHPSSMESSNETCVVLNAFKRSVAYHGYAVWSMCPWNWTDDNIRHKCQDENQGDLLSNLPVFDRDSYVTYKNRFCATCNRASDPLFWQLEVNCEVFNTTNLNFTNIMDLTQKSDCHLTKRPEGNQLHYLKRCIPNYQDCSGVTQAKNKTFCQKECLKYALPVCYENPNGKHIRFKNPHCALCNGLKPSYLGADCRKGSGPISPSLTVLFDFRSTSEYQVRFKDSSGSVFKLMKKRLSCSPDEVYDPYIDMCKKVAQPATHSGHQNNTHNETETARGNETESIPNCSLIAFNTSDYKLFPNNSVFLKPHGRIYSNTSYKISETGLLLCVNFSRNFTTTQKEKRQMKMRSTPASLQLLTSIGCIVSTVSLVLLLMTYILFPELRNLPGKIVINLASSLLLYQVVFFLAVDTSDKVRCLVVAVLLHFFTLSSFLWMNVMAFDIRRTFTAKGSVATAQQDGHKKRLLKYSLYSWMTPVLVVVICLVVDHVEDGSVGYGRSEEGCFISTPQARLYSFVLPVGLLMLFNVFALGHTLLHIVKTRKKVQQVTNQRPGSSITLICVKMVSVMGVTWLLGVAANFKALSFLWYPFVVLNSLQGFFIFLSFAVSGRALELYKSKLTKFLQTRKKVSGPSVASTDIGDEKVKQETTEVQDTHF